MVTVASLAFLETQLDKTRQNGSLKSVRVVQLHAQDELTYELRLATRPPADEG